MGQHFTPAAQLFFVMNYLVASPLTEQQSIMNDLLPGKRSTDEWELLVEPALRQCRALEQAVYDVEPKASVDETQFDAIVDELHGRWDHLEDIRTLRNPEFSAGYSEEHPIFAYGVYCYWIGAILVEYFDILGAELLTNSVFADIYDDIRVRHGDSLYHLKRAIESRMAKHANSEPIATQYAQELVTGWAAAWRDVVLALSKELLD